MSARDVVWRSAVTLTVALALLGTVRAMPLAVFAASSFALATVGAMLGLAFRPDLPGVRHPILGGALILLLPGLYPGLAELVGPAAPGVVTVLVLTSPWLAARIVRWSRGRLLPTETQVAASAPPEEALRRQWEESTRLLELASTPRERMLAVDVRAQILDDLLRQTHGVLPGYVWASVPGPDGRGRTGRGT